MEQLCNGISTLEIKVDNDISSAAAIARASAATDQDHCASTCSGNSVNQSNSCSSSGEEGIGEENKKKALASASIEYKCPLVWIDLEMTGLNIEVDRILEIACIITDGHLKKLVEGPDLVVHQSQECLDKMGEWCQTHHSASGLTKKVQLSTVLEGEAENQVIEFVKKYAGKYTPLLAGNSVYVDFLFLKKYMPSLASLFSHIVVDVSSIKALCLRWYPREYRKIPSKEQKHRAMEDIRESITELKFYKENIFKQPPSTSSSRTTT